MSELLKNLAVSIPDLSTGFKTAKSKNRQPESGVMHFDKFLKDASKPKPLFKTNHPDHHQPVRKENEARKKVEAAAKPDHKDHNPEVKPFEVKPVDDSRMDRELKDLPELDSASELNATDKPATAENSGKQEESANPVNTTNQPVLTISTDASIVSGEIMALAATEISINQPVLATVDGSGQTATDQADLKVDLLSTVGSKGQANLVNLSAQDQIGQSIIPTGMSPVSSFEQQIALANQQAAVAEADSNQPETDQTVVSKNQTRLEINAGRNVSGTETTQSATDAAKMLNAVNFSIVKEQPKDSGDHSEKSDVNSEAALVKPLADGEGKPLNLAVIQTRLAVGESSLKTNSDAPVLTVQTQNQALPDSTPEATQTGTAVVKKEDLFPQIIERAKVMLSSNRSEMEVTLKPDHLGKIQLKVAVENQIVTARFVAESLQVKQIIESGLSDLRHQLQDSGVQVDVLTVSVSSQNAGQTFDQAAADAQGGFNRFSGSGRHSGEAEVEADGELISRKPEQSTVIDLMA